MTTWQRFVPSNPTFRTPQLDHLLGGDSLSDPPELPEEETLDFQEEYPQEEVEEAEEEVEEEAGEVTQEYRRHHNKEQILLEIN